MREVKGVSFNLNEPFEQKLIAHSKLQGRFSNYVKRLIQRDMENFTNISNSNIQKENSNFEKLL